MIEKKQNKKICWVEDDIKLSSLIKTFLCDEGFEVVIVQNGHDAVQVVKDTQPDVVLLDIMLPGVDGVEICRRLSQVFLGPIIFLTGTENEFAEITALNFGAEKFLQKPIKPQLLLAHLNSSITRFKTINNKDSEKPQSALILDENMKRAWMSGNDLQLSPNEFDLLALLKSKSGMPIRREKLHQAIRGTEFDGVDRYVDLKISSLRRKLGDDAPPFKLIKTMRNQGYMLCEDDIKKLQP